MTGELSADRLAELRESEDLRANVSERTVDELLSHIDALTARIAELTKPVGKGWRRDYVQKVHDTFAAEIARGYISNDKTFAVDLLGKALAETNPFGAVTSGGKGEKP